VSAGGERQLDRSVDSGRRATAPRRYVGPDGRRVRGTWMSGFTAFSSAVRPQDPKLREWVAGTSTSSIATYRAGCDGSTSGSQPPDTPVVLVLCPGKDHLRVGCSRECLEVSPPNKCPTSTARDLPKKAQCSCGPWSLPVVGQGPVDFAKDSKHGRPGEDSVRLGGIFNVYYTCHGVQTDLLALDKQSWHLPALASRAAARSCGPSRFQCHAFPAA